MVLVEVGDLWGERMCGGVWGESGVGLEIIGGGMVVGNGGGWGLKEGIR